MIYTASKRFTLLNTFILICVVFVTLYPVIYVASLSLSDPKAIMQMKVKLWPVDISVEGYKLILEDKQFWTGYKNTIIYTVTGTFTAMVFTILCAYPLSKGWLKGQKTVLKLFVFTMFFNGGLIPNFLFIKSLGMINSIWAIILPLAVNPFNMIIMMTFFKSLPETLEQAAEIDGLNPLQILTRIVLPLSKAILATIGLFYAVYYWNEWFRPMIFLNDSGKQPVTLFLRNLVMGHQLAAQNGVLDESAGQMVAENLKSASIVVVSIPILMIYPFIQRYFVKGIMLGSVKG